MGNFMNLYEAISRVANKMIESGDKTAQTSEYLKSLTTLFGASSFAHGSNSYTYNCNCTADPKVKNYICDNPYSDDDPTFICPNYKDGKCCNSSGCSKKFLDSDIDG
jgi:hypothetical protein